MNRVPGTRNPLRGRGWSGMAPAARVEVWIWALDPVRVTLAGQLPRDHPPGWRAAVLRALSAEALAMAQEAEGTRAPGQR